MAAAEGSPAEFTLRVISMVGAEVAELTLPASVSVMEVMEALHQRGLPRPRQQRLVTNDDAPKELCDRRAPLLEACGLEEAPAELTLTLIQTDPVDRSLALKSLGASIRGPNSGCGEVMPLLQHDVVFPPEEFGDELLTLDLAKSVSHEFAGVPEGFRTGCQLAGRMREANGAWDTDLAQSTFLDTGTIELVLPGSGARLVALGFTYSPWDRNYGSGCAIYGKAELEDAAPAQDEHAGSSGSEDSGWSSDSDGAAQFRGGGGRAARQRGAPAEDSNLTFLGEAIIEYHTERGDPNIEQVKTHLVAVPDALQETAFKSVVFKFGNGRGSYGGARGRRLYFLHALGSLV